MTTCAHCGGRLCPGRLESTRRFCSARCRQAAYRRRRQRLREDLSDLDPRGARRLRDREIVAAGASGAVSWIDLYRELLRHDVEMARRLQAVPADERGRTLPDHELIESERRRVRARYRFWAETMTPASGAAAGGA